MGITPSLWCNGNVEEAVRYDVWVFPNSEILGVTRALLKLTKSDIATLRQALEDAA